MDLINRPYGLLAELTYSCPLHCPYCSNPIQPAEAVELDTEEWKRVVHEAAALGVLQIGYSGGEPLQRKDLESLVQAARQAGMYTNLITSGLGLGRSRAARLLDSGLDNVQISFQAATEDLANRIAGVRNGHTAKLRVVEIIKETGLALSLNVVLHRLNIESLDQIIAFSEKLGATRLELAHAQYYGWAYRNRSLLIPTRPQVETAARIALTARKRLRGTMEILYVLPDYFTNRPKPCMNGWGHRYLTVNPSGFVLPCPTAWEIAGLKLESVRGKSLSWIWEVSDSFNRFRGTEWMPEPCRSCPQREVDFGGCRCQAALLTGDPSNTDPACEFAPHHQLVRQAVGDSANRSVIDDFVLRENPFASVKRQSSSS
jgi:pyrroloquinoline quinone biosynthesis protein E